MNRFLPRILLSLLPMLFALLPTVHAGAAAIEAPAAITADGARYYGPLVDGKRQGKGRLEWGNGARYEGGFDNGLMSGHGVLKSPDGSVYAGEFRNGVFSGKGRLETGHGDVYEGVFENGLYSGHGEFVHADGRRYRGEFVKGELTGQGSYSLPNGAHYEGSLKNSRADGKGKYTDENGDVYEGNFEQDDLNGPGKMTGKDGSRYAGEFSHWRYQGKGIFRSPDGDEYKGSFVDGLYEGEGTLTYAQPQDDGRTRDSGLWRQGAFVDTQAERKTRLNVETALYHQRALLDKALASLMPRDPNKINLYLLSVAGDGEQEVFRREAEFVKREFDRDFGTAGHSLLLINSRSTVASVPMATITSLRESLNAVAAKMDRDKDVLLLFLTSHGTHEHQFVLEQNGMELNYLEPKELAALLKQSGIKWKAVIVSACYSGGFIDDLKDDHTLIITAARKDRTSFGCADENDFTYFGRAFFKESLPHSTSFQDAFSKASRLIDKWENDDIKEAGNGPHEDMHSWPQMVNPAPVDKYLREWWEQAKTK